MSNDMFNSQAATLAARRLDLVEQIDGLKSEMDEIDRQLEGLTTFPDGKATGHPEAGPGLKVTVTKKENITYSQPKLAAVRAQMGDSAFFQVFGWKFTPKKKELNGFMTYGPPEHKAAIEAARTMKPGKTAVKVERVEAGE